MANVMFTQHYRLTYNIMYKITSLVALTLLLTGCVPQSDYDAAKRRIASLEDSLSTVMATVEELENTPHERLARAARSSNASEAEAEYKALAEIYPQSAEASIARDSLNAIVARREAARVAEERRQRLGFKVLKEKRDIRVGPLRVQFTSVRTGNNFVHDRYDSRWLYNTAKRGYRFILADVRITADSDALNPSLPPILVYQAKGAELQYVGVMRYEFHRWKDYGTYLGNYHDSGNDFANSSTIRFNAGLEVENEILDSSVFIMVENRNCATRETNTYGNPEIRYSIASCIPKGRLRSLSVEEAEELYTVHIINKNKL